MSPSFRLIVVAIALALLISEPGRGQDPANPPPSQTALPSQVPLPEPTPPAPVPPSEDFGGAFGLGKMGGDGPGKPGYSVTWYPSRPVNGTATSLGLVRQSLSVAVPVLQDDQDKLLFTAGVKNTLYSTDEILPDTHRPFPADLWNISVGLNYQHRFENGWSGGIATNLGSASDKPFESIHEMYISLSTFLRIPAWNDRDAWLFSLMYSPVSSLNFPIPGIAYEWNPSNDLHVKIGLPFSVMWRPIEDLTLNASYVPLTNVNAKATYRLAEKVHIYGGYENLNESYFLSDRANNQDRFMSFEQRVIGGVRWNIWQEITLDVNAGYSFGRYFGEGQNQGADLHDRVDVAPGAFFGISFRGRF